MTTEPNGIVGPIHEKAMPVMLMTPDDVEQWLGGHTIDDALKMQRSAPDDAIVIRPPESGLAAHTGSCGRTAHAWRLRGTAPVMTR
jgi:putative SOS response-associated peptidase YedK